MSNYQQQRLHDKIYGRDEQPKKMKWLKRSWVKKKVADKRVVENEIYQKRRKSYLAKYTYCECGCGRLATEVHHKRGRRGKYRGESLLIVVKFFMAVSYYCHKKIHREQKWAFKMGYLLKRNTKTEKQPIMKKATATFLIIFLISLLALSFAQKPSYTTPHRESVIDTTKKNQKQDTSYYIANSFEWFQLLYKSVDKPDSVNKFERTALLTWISTLRPILAPDTTKKKPSQ